MTTISISRVPAVTSIVKALDCDAVSVSEKGVGSPSDKIINSSPTPSVKESRKSLSRVISRVPEEGASTNTIKELKSKSISKPETVIPVTS